MKRSRIASGITLCLLLLVGSRVSQAVPVYQFFIGEDNQSNGQAAQLFRYEQVGATATSLGEYPTNAGPTPPMGFPGSAVASITSLPGLPGPIVYYNAYGSATSPNTNTVVKYDGTTQTTVFSTPFNGQILLAASDDRAKVYMAFRNTTGTNYSLRVLDTATDVTTTLNATLGGIEPYRITYENSQLYLADFTNSRISIYDTSGTFQSSLISGLGAVPTRIRFDENGNALVSLVNGSLSVYDSGGTLLAGNIISGLGTIEDFILGPDNVISLTQGVSTIIKRYSYNPITFAANDGAVADITNTGLNYQAPIDLWVVPEPSSFALICFGFIGILTGRRRR